MNTVEISNDVRKVLARTLNALPVSKDLPRLARKVTIQSYDHNTNQHENVTPNTTPEEESGVCVFRIISRLNELFACVEPSELSEKAFLQQVNMNSHFTLTEYLVNTFGENSKMVRFLKACNQSVIIMIIFHIRSAFQLQKVDFKDVRGAWKVYFNTGNPSGGPSVIHRRKEQVYSKSNDFGSFQLLFQFEWEVEICYDAAISEVESVQVRLIRIIDQSEVVEAHHQRRLLPMHQRGHNSFGSGEMPSPVPAATLQPNNPMWSPEPTQAVDPEKINAMKQFVREVFTRQDDPELLAKVAELQRPTARTPEKAPSANPDSDNSTSDSSWRTFHFVWLSVAAVVLSAAIWWLAPSLPFNPKE